MKAGQGLAALALLVCVACGGSDAEQAPTELGAEESVGEPVAVELHFPGPQGRLYTETRMLDLPAERLPRTRRIVEALLAGPENEWMSAPFPEGVSLAAALEGKGGVLLLDFAGTEMPRPPIGGSTEEAQVVWSFVNSVVRNVEGVERIALLWNGTQPSSFGGHLDTRGALAPRLDLVQQ